MKIKKGQSGLEEIFYVLAYMFAAAIFVFIIYFVYQQIKDPVDTAITDVLPAGEQSFNATIIANQTTGGLGLFNVLYPFLLMGLIIMCVVSVFFIDSHPVFFFISLIVLGVVILLGIVFSNIYQQITTDSQFGNTSTNFSVINIFMKYLPWVIAVIVIVVMIVLFGRPGGGSTSGL